MLQNIPKDKVLEIVKQGPTLPAKISKQLGGDTMLIGAILSTLISTGDVKVSSLKIGGSPLYYVPDHESKLEDFLDHINAKDRKAFELLKAERVLPDSSQDPLTRVSLRAIKDFAKPLDVDYQGQKLLFWRFYSVPKDEASSMAKTIAKKVLEDAEAQARQAQAQAPSATPPAIPVQFEQPSHPAANLAANPAITPAINPAVAPATRIVGPESDAKQNMIRPVQDTIGSVQDQAPKSSVVGQADMASMKDSTALKAHHHGHVHEHDHEQHDEHKDAHNEEHKDEHKEKHVKPKAHDVHEVHEVGGVRDSNETHEVHDVHKAHADASKKTTIQKPKAQYDFYSLILSHVASKGLDMISKEKIKKTEYDMVLKNHQTNEYIYCKAKDKPSVSEGDLAPAMIFAQNKKMPCLFLSTGSLTKKAESMLGKELAGLKFEKIIIS